MLDIVYSSKLIYISKYYEDWEQDRDSLKSCFPTVWAYYLDMDEGMVEEIMIKKAEGGLVRKW